MSWAGDLSYPRGDIKHKSIMNWSIPTPESIIKPGSFEFIMQNRGSQLYVVQISQRSIRFEFDSMSELLCNPIFNVPEEAQVTRGAAQTAMGNQMIRPPKGKLFAFIGQNFSEYEDPKPGYRLLPQPEDYTESYLCVCIGSDIEVYKCVCTSSFKMSICHQYSYHHERLICSIEYKDSFVMVRDSHVITMLSVTVDSKSISIDKVFHNEIPEGLTDSTILSSVSKSQYANPPRYAVVSCSGEVKLFDEEEGMLCSYKFMHEYLTFNLVHRTLLPHNPYCIMSVPGLYDTVVASNGNRLFMLSDALDGMEVLTTIDETKISPLEPVVEIRSLGERFPFLSLCCCASYVSVHDVRYPDIPLIRISHCMANSCLMSCDIVELEECDAFAYYNECDATNGMNAPFSLFSSRSDYDPTENIISYAKYEGVFLVVLTDGLEVVLLAIGITEDSDSLGSTVLCLCEPTLVDMNRPRTMRYIGAGHKVSNVSFHPTLPAIFVLYEDGCVLVKSYTTLIKQSEYQPTKLTVSVERTNNMNDEATRGGVEEYHIFPGASTLQEIKIPMDTSLIDGINELYASDKQ